MAGGCALTKKKYFQAFGCICGAGVPMSQTRWSCTEKQSVERPLRQCGVRLRWYEATIEVGCVKNRLPNRQRSTLPAGGQSRWSHNPEHRGGTPCRDRTADRFGGSPRRDSLSQRQASAQQRISRSGGNLGATAPAASGTARVAPLQPGGGSAIEQAAPVLVEAGQVEPIASAAET